LAVGIGLVALLLNRFDAHEVIKVIFDSNKLLLLLAFMMFFPNRVLAAHRWLILLRNQFPSLRLWSLVRLLYVSGYLGTLVPGTVGIELVRIYGLAKSTADLAFSATSVMIDRILALFALYLLAFFGIIFTSMEIKEEYFYIILASFLVFLIAALLLYNNYLRHALVRRLPAVIRPYAKEKLEKLYGCLDKYRSQPRLLAFVFVLSVIFQLYRVVHIYVFSLSLNIDVGLMAFVLVAPVAMLITMLPISIGGLGVRESVFVIMLTNFGVRPEASLAMSLLVTSFSLLWLLPGAWFYMRRGIGG
jgi:uncharacterized protein (TIRG00374 family)